MEKSKWIEIDKETHWKMVKEEQDRRKRSLTEQELFWTIINIETPTGIIFEKALDSDDYMEGIWFFKTILTGPFKYYYNKEKISK